MRVAQRKEIKVLLKIEMLPLIAKKSVVKCYWMHINLGNSCPKIRIGIATFIEKINMLTSFNPSINQTVKQQ